MKLTYKELKNKLKNDNIIAYSYHQHSFRASSLANQLSIDKKDLNEDKIIELISDVFIMKGYLVNDFNKWRNIFLQSMIVIGTLLLLQILNILVPEFNSDIFGGIVGVGMLTFIGLGIKFYNINNRCQYLEDVSEGMYFKRTHERLKDEVDGVIKMDNRARKLNKILEDA